MSAQDAAEHDVPLEAVSMYTLALQCVPITMEKERELKVQRATAMIALGGTVGFSALGAG